MKKLKNQKGITLVALIITIIILLILAVVALREITGDGIIAKAKEARTSYETEQGRENTTLAEYESELENALSDGGVNTELTEEEKVELEALILQYFTNRTEENKQLLLNKGADPSSTIELKDEENNTYFYTKNNLNLLCLATNQGAEIIDITPEERTILNNLYEVAVITEQKAKSGELGVNNDIVINHKGEEFRGVWYAAPWTFDAYHGYRLTYITYSRTDSVDYDYTSFEYVGL